MARRPKAEVVPVVVAERTEICRECRFCHYSRAEGMFCRRFPPSFAYDYQTGTSNPQWPAVNSDHWCGEFAPLLQS